MGTHLIIDDEALPHAADGACRQGVRPVKARMVREGSAAGGVQALRDLLEFDMPEDDTNSARCRSVWRRTCQSSAARARSTRDDGAACRGLQSASEPLDVDARERVAEICAAARTRPSRRSRARSRGSDGRGGRRRAERRSADEGTLGATPFLGLAQHRTGSSKYRPHARAAADLRTGTRHLWREQLEGKRAPGSGFAPIGKKARASAVALPAVCGRLSDDIRHETTRAESRTSAASGNCVSSGSSLDRVALRMESRGGACHRAARWTPDSTGLDLCVELQRRERVTRSFARAAHLPSSARTAHSCRSAISRGFTKGSVARESPRLQIRPDAPELSNVPSASFGFNSTSAATRPARDGCREAWRQNPLEYSIRGRTASYHAFMCRGKVRERNTPHAAAA